MMNPRAKGRDVLDQRSLRQTTVAQEYVSMECNAFCLPLIRHVAIHVTLRNACHVMTQKMITYPLHQKLGTPDVVRIVLFVHSSNPIHYDHAWYQLVPTIALIYVMNASTARVWRSALTQSCATVSQEQPYN